MSFPNISYKSTNIEVDEKLYELTEQKLTSLDKYIGDETDVKCEVEFEKVAPHNSGEIYRVEVNFWLKGKMYRAESTKESFDTAIVEARDELEREVRKEQDKRQTLVKKGGREMKDAMRFGKSE